MLTWLLGEEEESQLRGGKETRVEMMVMDSLSFY